MLNVGISTNYRVAPGKDIQFMATKSADCLFCHVKLPFSEIEWHMNNHLDEEEFSRDLKRLARP